MKLKPNKGNLTAARLREVLRFDESISRFRWTCNRGSRAIAGEIAGGQTGLGYRCVGIDGVVYMEHRLVWLWTTGAWPEQVIDHIDGNGLNNHPSNLRDVSQVINMQNQRRAKVTSITGLAGVKTVAGRRPTARITVDGQTRYLGAFDTPEAAHQAYLVAKRLLHAGCSI